MQQLNHALVMNILPSRGHGLGGINDTALRQFIIALRITHHPSNSFSCFCCCFIWGIRGHLRCIGKCTVSCCFFLSLFAQHALLFFSTPSTIPHVPLLMPFLFSACFPSSHDRCISHPLHTLFFKILHVNFFSIFLIPSFFSCLFVHYFLFLVDATLTLISPHA